MNIDMRHFVPRVLVKAPSMKVARLTKDPTAPAPTAASPPQKACKRLDNVRAMRDAHSYVRLLTAYANGPDRNIFILRVLGLFDTRKVKRTKQIKWSFLRRVTMPSANELVSQTHIMMLAEDLCTSPQGLAKLIDPVVTPRPRPEIDWETDSFKALLAYARREPLTLYHELRVVLAVKKMPMTVFADSLRQDLTQQQDAVCWSMQYMKNLTTEGRLNQALHIIGMKPNMLLLRLPPAL
ncbi:MAG: hypothetical protein EON60_10420 [Alphaproteobacteria bacterium]|nr:MAG: hypothetical protein EON60_10420 [Alphaproteobacteria bacterium]